MFLRKTSFLAIPVVFIQKGLEHEFEVMRMNLSNAEKRIRCPSEISDVPLKCVNGRFNCIPSGFGIVFRLISKDSKPSIKLNNYVYFILQQFVGIITLKMSNLNRMLLALFISETDQQRMTYHLPPSVVMSQYTDKGLPLFSGSIQYSPSPLECPESRMSLHE